MKKELKNLKEMIMDCFHEIYIKKWTVSWNKK